MCGPLVVRPALRPRVSQLANRFRSPRSLLGRWYFVGWHREGTDRSSRSARRRPSRSHRGLKTRPDNHEESGRVFSRRSPFAEHRPCSRPPRTRSTRASGRRTGSASRRRGARRTQPEAHWNRPEPVCVIPALARIIRRLGRRTPYRRTPSGCCLSAEPARRPRAFRARAPPRCPLHASGATAGARRSGHTTLGCVIDSLTPSLELLWRVASKCSAPLWFR